jgi:hypothetical protein
MRISRRVLIGILSAITIVAIIGALVWYSTYRAKRDLEIEAARAIVAWVFEDQPMPNYEEFAYGMPVPGTIERGDIGYKASASMREADRWYVICDFLPEGVSLSDNPRIERISYEEAQAIRSQAVANREGSFLVIVRSRDESGRVVASENKVGFVMLATHGPLGADMYEFVFTRVDGQLNVTGTWVGGS